MQQDPGYYCDTNQMMAAYDLGSITHAHVYNYMYYMSLLVTVAQHSRQENAISYQ